MMEPLLKTSNLSKSFGGIKAVQDFNIYFSRCMGVVTGSNVAGLTQFVPVDLDGRNYMTFVSKNVEYYILMEESYPFELLK